MTPTSHFLRRFCFSLCLAAVSAALPLHAATQFELLPGSSITLSNGPTESLSGTFTWAEGDPGSIEGVMFTRFDVTELQLQSPSTAFTLSATSNLFVVIALPNGLVGESLAANGYADVVGLPVSIVNLIGYDGFYSSSPTGSGITFPDLRIFDTAGTREFGNMSFTAIQVPEPSSAALCYIALAAAGVLGRIRRRCNPTSKPVLSGGRTIVRPEETLHWT